MGVFLKLIAPAGHIGGSFKLPHKSCPWGALRHGNGGEDNFDIVQLRALTNDADGCKSKAKNFKDKVKLLQNRRRKQVCPAYSSPRLWSGQVNTRSGVEYVAQKDACCAQFPVARSRSCATATRVRPPRMSIKTQTRRSGAIFSTSATKVAKGPLVNVT